MRGAWRRFLKSLAWGGGPDKISREGLAAALARLRQERTRIYGGDARTAEITEGPGRTSDYTRPMGGWR